MRLLAKSTMCMDPEKFCFSTPCQNHLYIEDESQNFDEMRAVGSSSPARGRFRNFSTFDLASSSTDDFQGLQRFDLIAIDLIWSPAHNSRLWTLRSYDFGGHAFFQCLDYSMLVVSLAAVINCKLPQIPMCSLLIQSAMCSKWWNLCFRALDSQRKCFLSLSLVQTELRLLMYRTSKGDSWEDKWCEMQWMQLFNIICQ